METKPIDQAVSEGARQTEKEKKNSAGEAAIGGDSTEKGGVWGLKLKIFRTPDPRKKRGVNRAESKTFNLESGSGKKRQSDGRVWVWELLE